MQSQSFPAIMSFCNARFEAERDVFRSSDLVRVEHVGWRTMLAVWGSRYQLERPATVQKQYSYR